MQSTAIVTGGTGGLGRPSSARLLDDGWRVVVPWIVEQELERCRAPARTGAGQGRSVRAGGRSRRSSSWPRRQPLRAAAGSGEPGRGLRGRRPSARDVPSRRSSASSTSTCGPPTSSSTRRCRTCSPARAARSCASARARRCSRSPGAAGYIASKAAVIAFAQAVAVEYRGDGIRCNAILPSVIDTPGNRASMPMATTIAGSSPSRSPA